MGCISGYRVLTVFNPCRTMGIRYGTRGKRPLPRPALSTSSILGGLPAPLCRLTVHHSHCTTHRREWGNVSCSETLKQAEGTRRGNCCSLSPTDAKLSGNVWIFPPCSHANGSSPLFAKPGVIAWPPGMFCLVHREMFFRILHSAPIAHNMATSTEGQSPHVPILYIVPAAAPASLRALVTSLQYAGK
jgi:hypothetical protein